MNALVAVPQLAPNVALVAVPSGRAGPETASLSRRRPPFGTVLLDRGHEPLRIAAMLVADNDDMPLAQPLEPVNLAETLETPDRARLLGFLLNFCGSAFRVRDSAAFAAVCARLLEICASPAGDAQVIAEVLPDLVLVHGINAPNGSTLTIVGRGRVVHNTMPPSRAGEPRLLPRLEPGDRIVACGAGALVWTVTVPSTIPHILALGENGLVSGSLARTVCRGVLGRAAPWPPAAELLRAMALLHPLPPRKLDKPGEPVGGEVEFAIPDGEDGLFLAGWIRDPLALVGTTRLMSGADVIPLTEANIIRLERPDIAKKYAGDRRGNVFESTGFVAHVPAVAPGPVRIVLDLRAGGWIELVPAPRALSPEAARDAVLGYVPAALTTPDLMRRCLAPAAARLHRQTMCHRAAPDVVRIGAPVRRPRLSVLIPLYRDLGFVPFQLAAFAEDPQMRNAEVVYILDSPEQRIELEHLLRGLVQLTGIAITLVLMPRNRGYAAASNEGARLARAPLLLLLNSDVVPGKPGWLAPLLAPFENRRVAITGARLLFEDDSIQHAGLYFDLGLDGVWFNRHYCKGMPRRWAAASRRRSVPAVTGAALAIRRTAFEQAGGICEDYIVGDYEDTDLCLRVREQGGTIVYTPDAELYHFERRSISLHTGYTETQAAFYNRILHHDRWNGAIAALMARAAGGRA